MELSFAVPDDESIFRSSRLLKQRWGASCAAIIRQRICELIAADTLSVAELIATLGLKAVEPSGDQRRLRISVDNTHALLICVPGDARHADSLDTTRVNAIQIVGIEVLNATDK